METEAPRTNVAYQFVSSAQYWEDRYANGENSFAHADMSMNGPSILFKSTVVKSVARMLDLRSCIDFGCGDMHTAMLFGFEDYVGVDVSPTLIQRLRELNPRGKFFLLGEQIPCEPKPDCCLSLDVAYHIVEQDAFQDHFDALFRHASKAVILYTTDTQVNNHSSQHIRHRLVPFAPAGWTMKCRIPSRPMIPSNADFFIYTRK